MTSRSEFGGDMIPRAQRWTVADEMFAAFLARPLSHQRRMRLNREAPTRRREVDRKLAAERDYDEETEKYRQGMRLLAGNEMKEVAA